MKGKEIKFRREIRTLEGRQDGVIYRIYEGPTLAGGCAPACTVTAYDTKDLGRTISTSGHLLFHLDAAKEFCQRIAAGEIDLEDLRAKFAAEDAAKDREAILAATERAKAFRGRLEAAGISYTTLLELEALHDKLGNLAHNILLGLERGEGLPNA